MAEDHTPPLQVGSFSLKSRLVVGTGKYETYEVMQDALAASGCDTVTVAVRRERLLDDQGRSLLDFLDLDRYTILPNTAGCFTTEDAVTVSPVSDICGMFHASMPLTEASYQWSPAQP